MASTRKLGHHVVRIPHELWKQIDRRRSDDTDLARAAMPMNQAIIVLLSEACDARERKARKAS